MPGAGAGCTLAADAVIAIAVVLAIEGDGLIGGYLACGK